MLDALFKIPEGFDDEFENGDFDHLEHFEVPNKKT